MKAIKTLCLAALAIFAIGATSCDKQKETKTEPATEAVNPLDSIMEITAKGEVAELTCDTILTPSTKVETTTVICFIAENAPACAPLQEPIAKLAAEGEGKVAVITADVTACPITAASFGLDADMPLVPCVVILDTNGDTQTYPDLSSFITPELEKKSAEEQAAGIYATLANYAGITE